MQFFEIWVRRKNALLFGCTEKFTRWPFIHMLHRKRSGQWLYLTRELCMFVHIKSAFESSFLIYGQHLCWNNSHRPAITQHWLHAARTIYAIFDFSTNWILLKGKCCQPLTGFRWHLLLDVVITLFDLKMCRWDATANFKHEFQKVHRDHKYQMTVNFSFASETFVRAAKTMIKWNTLYTHPIPEIQIFIHSSFGCEQIGIFLFQVVSKECVLYSFVLFAISKTNAHIAATFRPQQTRTVWDAQSAN